MSLKKIDISIGLIKLNSSFVCLKRTSQPFENFIEFPGGKRKNNETAIQCLKREIKEEIGDVKILKTIPMETFISNDEAFLYHTYLCVVGPEFLPKLNKEHDGFAWCTFNHWPKPLHQGLRKTLQSKVNQTKLDTVFKILKFLDD